MVLLVAVPALLFFCQCCEAAPNHTGANIQKVRCQGCCPGSSEITRDCGTLYQKPAVYLRHDSGITAMALPQLETAFLVTEENYSFVLQASPPVSPPPLSVILRI